MNETRIFICAGEASGDAYGAALMLALLKLNPALEFEGIGGTEMAKNPFFPIANSRLWGAISIYESVKSSPKILRGYFAAVRRIRAGNPGIFIAIDFGFMNVRLLRVAKIAGWKTVYFMPPSAWKRRDPVSTLPKLKKLDLAANSDLVIVPFDWNLPYYESLGATVRYFGHPLLELRQIDAQVSTSRKDFIAVMPGSREHELKMNLPLIASSLPDSVPAIFCISSSNSPAKIKEQWEILARNRDSDTFLQGQTTTVLQEAKVGIICSGTATLEAALLNCPLLVIYKFPKIVEIEGRIIGFKRPPFISLPNIILQRMAVPELVQENATPENCRKELQKLLSGEEPIQLQQKAFQEIRGRLGSSHAISDSAKAILGLG